MPRQAVPKLGTIYMQIMRTKLKMLSYTLILTSDYRRAPGSFQCSNNALTNCCKVKCLPRQIQKRQRKRKKVTHGQMVVVGRLASGEHRSSTLAFSSTRHLREEYSCIRARRGQKKSKTETLCSVFQGSSSSCP